VIPPIRELPSPNQDGRPAVCCCGRNSIMLWPFGMPDFGTTDVIRDPDGLWRVRQALDPALATVLALPVPGAAGWGDWRGKR
jgi:hypothetical protein